VAHCSNRLPVALLVIALLASACDSAVPTPSASTRPAVLNTPPAASTAVRPASASVRATAVSIPGNFAYVEASPGRDVTLWLVDLSGAKPPARVAQWTLGSHTWAASRDGKTIVVAAPGAHSIVALHLVRPLTGEATVLYEGPSDARAFFQRLSPDGKRFAFSLGRAAGWDGLWVGDVSDGTVRQLLPQPIPRDPTSGSVFPISWSDDGNWLTYSAADESDLGAGPKIFAHNVVDGRRVVVGKGSLVSWREQEPRLLVATNGGSGSQGAFGATLYTFDLSQQRRAELFSFDPRVTAVAWNPARDEFAYLLETTGCSYHATVWVSTARGPARRVGSVDSAEDAWWSSDGATIYALARGVGTDAVVLDATSAREVAKIPNGGPAQSCT